MTVSRSPLRTSEESPYKQDMNTLDTACTIVRRERDALVILLEAKQEEMGRLEVERDMLRERDKRVGEEERDLSKREAVLRTNPTIDELVRRVRTGRLGVAFSTHDGNFIISQRIQFLREKMKALPTPPPLPPPPLPPQPEPEPPQQPPQQPPTQPPSEPAQQPPPAPPQVLNRSSDFRPFLQTSDIYDHETVLESERRRWGLRLDNTRRWIESWVPGSHQEGQPYEGSGIDSGS